MFHKLYIKGMSCEHCKKRVEEALKNHEAIRTVKVNLDDGTADLDTIRDMRFDELNEVIQNSGYELVKIEKK
ncbi:MAG: copper chaperone [Kosmotogales bacterium]|nr:copper chaperone [Kosmotogales bacterium]